MKGYTKLALASAVLAASTAALAMEPMQDEAMSEATGQAGLTILMSGVSVSANAVRYYDSDGTTGAAAAYGMGTTVPVVGIPAGLPGPCAGMTTLACANSFTTGGAVSLNGFSLTASSMNTTIDVGSTSSTGSTAVTGLLIGSSINNLNINLGAISVDNGDELGGSISASRAGTNTPVYTAGALTSGSDLGGLAITGVTIPNSLSLITAGAPQLGTNSGLTITSLLPITSMSMTVSYYDTSRQVYTAGTGFTGQGTHAGTSDGLISLPINLYGIVGGPIEIAAGNAGGGYATTTSEGLEVLMTGLQVQAVDIGGEATGGSGIQLAVPTPAAWVWSASRWAPCS